MRWFRRDKKPRPRYGGLFLLVMDPNAPNAHLGSVVTYLDPDEVAGPGLPAEAIIGFTKDNLATVEGFARGRAFREFFLTLLATEGPQLPSMKVAAESQQAGYLYVIDLRTPDGLQGNVPIHDIIGAFKVENGTVVPDSFSANEEHRMFTDDGIMQLPSELHDLLVTRLLSLRPEAHSN